MKIHIIAGAISTLIATSAFAAEQTWTGVISDKMCGADQKKMGGKMSDGDCTQACAKGGAPYVLVSEGKVYQVTNHDADLRTHAGHTVHLTGEFKGRHHQSVENRDAQGWPEVGGPDRRTGDRGLWFVGLSSTLRTSELPVRALSASV